MIILEILLLVFKPGDLSWALYLLHCLHYQIDHKTSECHHSMFASKVLSG